MNRHISHILLILLLFASCTRDKKQDREASVREENKKNAREEKVLILPWTATTNPQTGQLELKFDSRSNAGKLSVQDMVDAINLKYPDIRLQLKGRNQDTVKVFIKDASYLTQDMGTTGAESYLAEATFALTELKGVKAVNFDFKEGDHAAPKTYTRNDFRDLN